MKKTLYTKKIARITLCETKQQNIKDDLSKINTDTGYKIQVIVIFLHCHVLCSNFARMHEQTLQLKEKEIDVKILIY